MNPKFIFLFYWTHLPQLMCIYLAVWAYRYQKGVDYRFDRVGMLARWVLTLSLFVIAVLFPTANGRAVLLYVALAFFCWPNFCYHLITFFRKPYWPNAEASVVHVGWDESRQAISYSFQFRGEIYGGTSLLKTSTSLMQPDERITIRFDPANPDRSEIVA
jgi:hypothetical protein